MNDEQVCMFRLYCTHSDDAVTLIITWMCTIVNVEILVLYFIWLIW